MLHQLWVTKSCCCAYVRGSGCIPLAGADFAFLQRGETGRDNYGLHELNDWIHAAKSMIQVR